MNSYHPDDPGLDKTEQIDRLVFALKRSQTNGDAFTKVLLGVVAILIAAAVVGMWAVSNNVSTLNERVAGWTTVFGNLDSRLTQGTERDVKLDERLRQIEIIVNRNNARLDTIEREIQRREFKQQ